MTLRSILSALMVVLFLTGCGSNPVRTVTVTRSVYPNLLDVPPVEFTLQPWEYDYPRDMNAAPIVRSTNACLRVEEENQDAAFWKRCGIQPVDLDSNIFVGLDSDNWQLLTSNFAVLKGVISQYQERIDQVNKQRAKWRENNTSATAFGPFLESSE